MTALVINSQSKSRIGEVTSEERQSVVYSGPGTEPRVDRYRWSDQTCLAPMKLREYGTIEIRLLLLFFFNFFFTLGIYSRGRFKN